ncbi:MAG: response regulator [Acidobacteriota bacterium]
MNCFYRRRPLISLLLAVICGWLGSSPALAVGEGQRPGILELAGPWTYSVGDARPPDGAEGWRSAALPITASALGITGRETLWLRREIELGRGWERHLAPSGLAVMITNSLYGNYEVYVGEERIGSWRGPFPGISEPPPKVYPLPPGALDGRGRLQLTLRWQWADWNPQRVLAQQGQLGQGWIVGDRQRLQSLAELRQVQGLNADMPLVVLALLYVAIGAYHLQLFRRDRRCKEYLWFGLTAIIVASNTLLTTHWLAGVTAHYVIVRRLFDVTGLLMMASSLQFLWPFLSRPIGPRLRAYQMSFLALAAILAFMPETRWTSWVEAFSKVWSIPFLPAVAWLIASEVRRRNAEARTIALGGFAVVAAGTIEMSSQLLGLGSTFPLPSAAFTLFALSMAFSLSNRFSRVHDELDALRLQLEEMVEDRTAELSAANDRLQSQIAERELAQEAMRMLERAVEQSIDGILVADLEGGTLFVNEAWGRMHGRETFALLSSRIDLFHSAEQMENEVLPALAEVKSSGSWAGEVDHQRRDGSVFPTWMSITLLRDPVGEPVGFVAVARDITDRQRASEEKLKIESRLQETEKLTSLADLAGGIAHDYNNLLTGVLGNASLALKELPTESLAGEKLVHIGSAAERAADLTTQLLAYAGAEILITEAIDLNQLITAAQVELRRKTGSHRLEIDLTSDLPPIEADSTQVRQAIFNLVVNAAEANQRHGGTLVRLTTGVLEADDGTFTDAYPNEDLPSGRYVYVRVEDRGSGIDERARARMFDPFFTTKASSRGLGLATVLSTARAHRGTIRVTSQAGEGAAFELYFPAATVAPGAADEIGRAKAAWRGSGTILVVDDEQIMREVSRSILEQSGFEVLTTGEGRKALELYRENQANVRVVLLDRTMPTMSGIEVLEGILALDPAALVVMMSGYKKATILRELEAKGMTDFLPKPFRPQELLNKVRSVLEPAG